MTFKELRQNLPIHILDKGEMVYGLGKVVNVGMPRINTQAGQPNNFGTMPQMQMVVDVTVEWNGQTKTYTLADNASVAAVGSVMVSIDKADILKELQATKTDCEQYLANIDRKKEELEKCDKLIGELDTSFKERQETENRFKTIEETQKEQGNKLDKILEILSKDK